MLTGWGWNWNNGMAKFFFGGGEGGARMEKNLERKKKHESDEYEL